ncbi:hypothetical protein [Streptomyces sp. NBC_01803]
MSAFDYVRQSVNRSSASRTRPVSWARGGTAGRLCGAPSGRAQR